MIRRILERLLARILVLLLKCLNDPHVMVVLTASFPVAIPISCLILLIRSSLSSFSGSQYLGE